MKRSIILFFYCLFSFCLSAQDAEKTDFYIYPHDAYLKIDDTVYHVKKYPTSIDLTPGSHAFEVWAQSYKILKDTVVVKSGKKTLYRKRLISRNDNFQQYKSEIKAYNASRSKALVAKVVLPALNATALWIAIDGGSIQKLNTLKDRAELHRRDFISAINDQDIATARRNFDSARDEYNKKRKQLILKRSIGIPLVAVTSYLSYKLIKKVERNRIKEKPVLKKENNPFVLHSLDLTSEYNDIALQIKFNF